MVRRNTGLSTAISLLILGTPLISGCGSFNEINRGFLERIDSRNAIKYVNAILFMIEYKYTLKAFTEETTAFSIETTVCFFEALRTISYLKILWINSLF